MHNNRSRETNSSGLDIKNTCDSCESVLNVSFKDADLIDTKHLESGLTKDGESELKEDRAESPSAFVGVAPVGLTVLRALNLALTSSLCAINIMSGRPGLAALWGFGALCWGGAMAISAMAKE